MIPQQVRNTASPLRTVYTIVLGYLWTILFFTIFRIMLLLSFLYEEGSAEFTIGRLFQALIMGLRFDVVICGYVWILPAFMLFISNLLSEYPRRWIRKFILGWLIAFTSLAFAVSIIDIPYYFYFNERLSVVNTVWLTSSPWIAIRMVISHPLYILLVVIYAGAMMLFCRGLKAIFNKKEELKHHSLWVHACVCTLTLAVIFLGIRGRIESKSPIRVATAYFCNHPFWNKLGLNANFTFFKSLSAKNIPPLLEFMNNTEAIRVVHSALGVQKEQYPSPIGRYIHFSDHGENTPNVVLILMESMKASNMKFFGNKENLTPFLDSLAYQSHFFTHAFSTGKHTSNGVFSTLTGLPILYRQHPLVDLRSFNGIAYTLEKAGYQTSFFMTHDAMFDHMGGFLRANNFQKIFALHDYPSNEVKGTWGVPDDYMFSFAIDQLNNATQPFFTTLLSTSNHTPYYLPPYFTQKNPNLSEEKHAIQYADWALKLFFEKASQTKWFENTLFVLVADHGKSTHCGMYDIPLDYYHIPLFIYSPKMLSAPQIHTGVASQMDIFPTIMGILKRSYINNSMGIDLFRDKRSFALLNNNDKVGVINSDFLGILHEDYRTELFDYRNNGRENIAPLHPGLVDSMTTYAKAHLQVFQQMLLLKQTLIKSPK